MKRALSLILVLVLVLGLFCGCGKDADSKTDSDDKSSHSDSKKDDKQNQDEETGKDDNGTAAKPEPIANWDELSLRERVEALLGDSVDLSDYHVSEDDDLLLASLPNAPESLGFDFTISYAGLELQLDGKSTYQDVLDAGWSGDAPETLDGNRGAASFDVTSPDGITARIMLVNPAENSIDSKDGYVVRFKVENIVGNDLKIGQIISKSTAVDVIQAAGAPSSISSTNYIPLELIYRDYLLNDLELRFDESGVMTEVCFEFYLGNLH